MHAWERHILRKPQQVTRNVIDTRNWTRMTRQAKTRLKESMPTNFLGQNTGSERGHHRFTPYLRVRLQHLKDVFIPALSKVDLRRVGNFGDSGLPERHGGEPRCFTPLAYVALAKV